MKIVLPLLPNFNITLIFPGACACSFIIAALLFFPQESQARPNNLRGIMLPASQYILTDDNKVVVHDRYSQIRAPLTDGTETIYDFDVSPTHGRVVYVANRGLIELDPATGDQDLKVARRGGRTEWISKPRYSPDGSQISFIRSSEVWIIDSEISLNVGAIPLRPRDPDLHHWIDAQWWPNGESMLLIDRAMNARPYLRYFIYTFATDELTEAGRSGTEITECCHILWSHVVWHEDGEHAAVITTLSTFNANSLHYKASHATILNFQGIDEETQAILPPCTAFLNHAFYEHLSDTATGCGLLSLYPPVDGVGFAVRPVSEPSDMGDTEIIQIDQTGNLESIEVVDLDIDESLQWNFNGQGFIASSTGIWTDEPAASSLHWFGFSGPPGGDIFMALGERGKKVRWGPIELGEEFAIHAQHSQETAAPSVLAGQEITPTVQPTPLPDLVKHIGDYTVRLWSGTTNIAHHLPERGYYGTATITHEDGSRIIVPGAGSLQPLPAEDITGDGAPDIAFLTRGGGSRCCSGTVLYTLGDSPLRQLGIGSTGDYGIGARGTFEDLDSNGSYEFITNDSLKWELGGEFCSGLSVPVILGYQEGTGYIGATPTFADAYSREIERLTLRAEEDAENLCQLIPLVAAYSYVGQADKGWTEFERIYTGEQKLADLRSRLTAAIVQGRFYVPPTSDETKTITSTVFLPAPLYYLNEEGQIMRLLNTQPSDIQPVYVEEQVTDSHTPIDDFDVSSLHGRIAYVSNYFLYELDPSTGEKWAKAYWTSLDESSAGANGAVDNANGIFSPRYSHDGAWIAFIKNGVSIIRSGGGPGNQPVKLLRNVSHRTTPPKESNSNLLWSSNVEDRRVYTDVSWSPDNRRLLVRATQWEGSVYEIYDLETGELIPPLISPITTLPLNWGWAWGNNGQTGYVASDGFTLNIPVDIETGLSKVNVRNGDITLMDVGIYTSGVQIHRVMPRAVTAIHALPNQELLFFRDIAIRPSLLQPTQQYALFRMAADGTIVREMETTLRKEGEILWAQDGSGAILVQDVLGQPGDEGYDHLHPHGTLYWLSRITGRFTSLQVQGDHLRWGVSEHVD